MPMPGPLATDWMPGPFTMLVISTGELQDFPSSLLVMTNERHAFSGSNPGWVVLSLSPWG
jgi:hypothetical protein